MKIKIWNNKQTVRSLRNMRDQNTSAIETIQAINLKANGIVFTFKKDINLNVNWCLDEIDMLTKMAGFEIKKDQIEFWHKSRQLLLPFHAFNRK